MDCPECSHRTSRHDERGCQDSVPVNVRPIIGLPCPCPLGSDGRRTRPVVPKPALGPILPID